MTWLERILATECKAHNAKPGQSCMVPEFGSVAACASRIAAAEGPERGAAKKAKPRQHRHGLQLHSDGAYVWRKAHGVFTCKRCQTWINFDGKEMVYSHDNGATWTLGPDACPGRRP